MKYRKGRRLKKKRRKRLDQGHNKSLNGWVLEMVNATRNKKTKNVMLAGYTKAYVLAFLRVFHRQFNEWPTPSEIRVVFNYSQANKVRELLRALEDEGYIKLDEARLRVVEILKEPYITNRPQFIKEERLLEYYRRFSFYPPPPEGEASENS